MTVVGVVCDVTGSDSRCMVDVGWTFHGHYAQTVVVNDDDDDYLLLSLDVGGFHGDAGAWPSVSDKRRRQIAELSFDFETRGSQDCFFALLTVCLHVCVSMCVCLFCLLNALTAVVRVRFRPLFVCLSVCDFQHDISKTDAATELDAEMFHDESRKSICFRVRRSEVKVKSHKNSAGIGLCILVSAVFF